MKPRIFISAVTSELGTTRQLVANVLLRLGYDPVTQDILGTEPGDLRQVLRDKIDDCDGLIQLVGHGYGAEPRTVGTEFAEDGFTRISYTQFEFLYAREKEKKKSRGRFKTWLIYAEKGCTLDHPLEELDLPTKTATAVADATVADTASVGADAGSISHDPIVYQSERRALQDAWRQRWKQEGHLRHGASSDTELELKVERLKDEFRGLRRSFWRWQQMVTVALSVLLLLGGGIWWTVFRHHADVKQEIAQDHQDIKQVIQQTAADQKKVIEAELAKIRPEDIKDQLRKTIEATYQQEIQSAETLTEWQKRDEAKRDAAAARDKRLGQVDEFLTSITSTIQSGDASPEFLELTRIIQEQGVDQALAYITSQESRLLAEAEELTLQKRRKLAPLLEGVRLHRSKGELAEARTLCDKLLTRDADWLDVLHEHCWTMIDLGDRATKYETAEVALAHFEAAEVSAKRLVQADANNPIWQKDQSGAFERLSDVFQMLGRTDKALIYLQDGLNISRLLATTDPDNVQKKLDLSISFDNLGNVLMPLGRTDEALRYYQDGIKIIRGLVKADPEDVRKQGILANSFESLGIVLLAIGDSDEALTHHQEALKIRRGLAQVDRYNAQKKSDLSDSYDQLGDVLLTLGRPADALTHYQEALKIRDGLVQSDPNNTQQKSNLSISLSKLGDVLLIRGRPADALTHYQDAVKIFRELATTDRHAVQKQGILSVALGNLGNVSLALGHTDDAIPNYREALKIRRGLAEDDRKNAQKQSALSQLLLTFGEILLKHGHPDEALAHYQEALQIFRRLALADPNNTQNKTGLSISLDGLGNVSLALGHTDDALSRYQEAFNYFRELATADPNDVNKKRDLSISYDNLGNVLLKLGHTNDAFTHYQDALKIRRGLVQTDPGNAQKQRDLIVSHFNLGQFEVQAGRYQSAKEWFQAGIEGLERLIANGQNVAASQHEKAHLEARLRLCDTVLLASGDWEVLLKADAKLLPNLLSIRASEMARCERLVELAQTGAKLRELYAAENESANQQQSSLLYNAACAYSLCGMLVTKDKPQPTADELAERKKYLDLSFTCLKEALAAGFDNFEHMRQDSELAPLHDLPEFESLFPKTQAE